MIVDMNDKGPAVFDGVHSRRQKTKNLTMDDFALIDEISGLNDFLRNHMNTQAMSETQKDRIRAHMNEYKGPKDKLVAMNEMALSMYGDGR